MKKAVYPGSFDPITNGHLDIILRSSHFIDELIVAVVDNPNKESFFNLEERKEIVENVIRSTDKKEKIKVVSYSGLLVKFVTQVGANLIIRGLRAVSDFDYELKLTLMNRHLNKDIETIYLMTDEKNLFVNSSLLREIAFLGGDIHNHLPEYAYKKLMDKINNNKPKN
jgi:pantetheine-phosphate adenylyltransferase